MEHQLFYPGLGWAAALVAVYCAHLWSKFSVNLVEMFVVAICTWMSAVFLMDLALRSI
jgi:hypothetical protein